MRDIRRLLAVVTCTCLLLSGAGPAPLWAASARASDAPSLDSLKPGVSSREVMAYLERQGVFKGENAVLREYVGSNEFTTPLGAILYRHLKAQANPQEEAEALKPAFDALAKSGPISDAKRAVFQKQFQRYLEKFKGLPNPVEGDLEDTFQAGTLREAFMTGAASVDLPKARYAQDERPDGKGWDFFDEKGLAVTLNRKKVQVFRRDVQEMQRELNKTRPTGSPFIPETGQYNQQTFEVSWWRLKNQVEQLDLAMRLDRMVNMAELLGVQVKDQKWFDRNNPGKANAQLEADLTARAKDKTYRHKGRTYSVLDIVNAKTNVRRAYMAKAAEGLEYYKSEVAKLKDPDSITDGKVRAMQLNETYVLRYVSLAYLETQRHAVRNQLERIDPRSPDSALVGDSLGSMPLDDGAKAGYKAEREKMRLRLERLLSILGRTEDVLFKTDYAASMDIAQAALGQTQKEIAELGLNYELYVSVPAMLKAMNDQTGIRFKGDRKSTGDWFDPRKWNMNWGRSVYAWAPTDYSKGINKVEGAIAGYEGIARQIAKGDYHGARRSVIDMNPDAALQNPAMPLTGEALKLTDQVRLAAALKDTRETVAQVAETNRRVDIVQSIATWSVGVGFTAPAASRSLAWIGQHAAKAPVWRWHGKVFYMKGLPAACEQICIRLDSLNPSQELLNHERMRGPLLSYVRDSGYRSLNFGVRQLVFTGFSGGISGGFTAAGHWMDKAPFKADLYIMRFGDDTSNFSSGWDAFSQGAMGGAEWANQSFHPALGYIGMPSSRFEGTRLAAATEVVGTRGVTGIVGQTVKWGAGKIGKGADWSARKLLSGPAYNQASGWSARLTEGAAGWRQRMGDFVA
ncbi:MAG: hypothetical protein WC881_12035, partial [Elusimicrobiota bacterium]